MSPGRDAPVVLVVTPHATRTGSNRVLLDLLVAGSPFLPGRLRMHVGSGGSLADELGAIAPCLEPGSTPDVVVANSCLAAEYLVSLPADVPTATYIHETAAVLASLPARGRAGILRSSLVLCVSEAVRLDAIAFGVDPGRAVVLPPIVSPVAPPDEAATSAARTQMGAQPGQRIVAGCGEASWRKGTDLFLEVISRLVHRPDVHAAWIGRRPRTFARQLNHDASALGLAGRLTWVGEVADAAALLSAADVLVMPSRDDPQPLVPAEAAQLGTPSACFDIGGLAELITAGGAVGAPFPNVDALAAAIEALLDDHALGAGLVARMSDRIAARQSPAVVVPRFVEIVSALVAERSSSEGRHREAGT